MAGATHSRRKTGETGGPSWPAGSRRLAAWIALLAIVLQAWLPLLDARLHHHGSEPLTLAAAHPDEAGTPVSDRGTPDRQHCVIHQFMQVLGSYAAPAPALFVPPADGGVTAGWLPRAERGPDAYRTAARARAPPPHA